jgi:hypothetical protein
MKQKSILRNRCLIKQFQFILAVRKEIEPLTRKLKSSIPRRDDGEYFKIFRKSELAEEFLYLYEKRKDADYS